MTEQITHLRTHRKGPKRGLRYKAGSRSKEWEKALKLSKRALEGRVSSKDLLYLSQQKKALLSNKFPPPKGFLIPSLIEADEQTHGRWDWHLKNLSRGKIILPIPKIKFKDLPDQETFKMLEKMTKTIQEEGHYGSKAAELLIEWLAWGFGIKELTNFPISQKSHESLIKDFKLKLLLDNPADYMAQILQVSGHKGGPGWFSTPMGVCNMTAEILGGGKKPWESSVDPCIGTGSMLLPMSNKSLDIKGQDVSYLMVLASKVNFILYVPWAMMPYPKEMLDELRKEEEKKNDS